MLCSYEGVIAFSVNTKAVLNRYALIFLSQGYPKVNETDNIFSIFCLQHTAAT